LTNTGNPNGGSDAGIRVDRTGVDGSVSTGKKTTDITIVVCNYNGASPLMKTLQSVLQQQGVGIADVIVVDNNSTDDSIALIKEHFPDVRILSTGSNRGPNVARNYGLREAKTNLVLVMDNDLVLAQDYSARLAGVLVAQPRAGAVTGRIVFHHDPSITQYNGVDIHYAGEICPHDLAARGVRTCAAVSAGATMYRVSAVEAVGWFDESFVFGWEDGDLAYRLSLAGYGCWVDSDAVAEHQSQPRGFKWIRYQVRNRWWFMRRNYERTTFWICLPAIILFQCMAGLVLVLRGKGIEFIRGTLDGWRPGSEIRRKHHETQRTRRVSDVDLLVAAHFAMPAGMASSRPGRWMARGLFALFNLYWQLVKPILKLRNQ